MSPPIIELTDRVTPPAWALWERHLLDVMGRAARDFVARYTRPDGTLVWRPEWPGMDGSDDAYESFFNFPLLTALGGDTEWDALARAEWEAITVQFTGYGQIYREFDAYYDWMHHGESSLLFYYFGLTDPSDQRMRARAARFAAMYTGDDPRAPNYDPEHRLIRSPITGSRGPRFVNSAEDWVTHRPVLADYPPPFDDIPGIPADAKTADWNDDALFAEILTRMNERMMRGDVPMNLTATSLVAHAFLYSGAARYREWVIGYADAWKERADANGGLLPDNVGPSGKIGEHFAGKWYGGYYGWRWPHGLFCMVEPSLIAGANALLLTGDPRHLELPRQQLTEIEKRGRTVEGVLHLPHRHGDGGWYDYRPANPAWPALLWYLSMAEEDAGRMARWRAGQSDDLPEGRGKGDNTHTPSWLAYLQGRRPDYPERILETNYREVCRRVALMNADDTDPETWDVHHWQDRNPVVCEGLVQLMLGGPQAVYHGGLLHCRLRWFDPDRKRPGVPPDVAVLVSRVDADGVEVELVNLSPTAARRVVALAGAFGEHRFVGATRLSPSGTPAEEIGIGGKWLEIHLPPGGGGRLRLRMERYVETPGYGVPWRA